MNYLGIDFGTKRVGVAVADSETKIAIPKTVLPNNKFLFGEIKEFCKNHEVDIVVVGESKDFSGKENPVMKEIKAFVRMLEVDLQIPILLEPEYMTSEQAKHVHGGEGNNPMLDASAAAIILQSFLDKQKNK